MDYCENSDMLRAIEYVEESEESLLVKQLTEAENEIERLRDLIEREHDAPDVEDLKHELNEAIKRRDELQVRINEIRGTGTTYDDNGQAELPLA
jgi:predicted  nucleic acid-binding Zn-ribbon protein